MAQFRFTPSGAPTGTVSIQVEKPTDLIAPVQVWLKAINHSGLAAFEDSGSVYDGAHHEYYHEWTINGQPLSAFTAPENMVSSWNNPNLAYGREVAFCLSEAGDYVIDLVVVDKNGDSAEASTGTLTVVTPESHFADANRIYVDPDDGFVADSVPAGSDTATTLDQLNTKLLAAGSPVWVLFRAGKDYDMTTLKTGPNANQSGSMWINGNRLCRHISSYGAGTKPNFIPSTDPERQQTQGLIDLSGAIEDLTIAGLQGSGLYDSTKELGSTGQDSFISLGGITSNGKFFTVHDCEVTGMNRGINTGAGGTDTHVMVADCSITDWADYGMFGGGSNLKITLIGNRIVQNVDALSGGAKGDGFANQHGCYRAGSHKALYIAMNDLFSRNGWSQDFDDPADQEPREVQPCLRLGTDPASTQVGTVERNVMEGGYIVCSLEQEGGSAMPPANYLIERNLLISNAQNKGKLISSPRSGVSIRGNYMWRPDVEHPIGGNPAIDFNDSGTNAADRFTNPIRVYSNTLYTEMDGTLDETAAGAFAFSSYAASYTNETEENNLFYKPNAGEAGPAPIGTGVNFTGATTRHKGTRWGFDLPDHVLTADWTNGSSFTVDYTVFTQRLQDGTALGDNTTDQSYWQTNSAPTNNHGIYNRLSGGEQKYTVDEGHFTVSFDGSFITFTNTSGITLAANGDTLRIKMDRHGVVPALDTTYASNGLSIPIARPESGSTAYETATGLVTEEDLLLADRAASPSKGALNP